MTDCEVENDVISVYLPISNSRLDYLEKMILQIREEKRKLALECFERIKVLNKRLIAKWKQRTTILKKNYTDEDMQRFLSVIGERGIIYTECGNYSYEFTRRVVKYDLQ